VFHISAIVEPKLDTFGRHDFVRKKSAGRSIRHHTLNELVHLVLSRQQQFPARRNRRFYVVLTGKRPDGLTLFPWQSGRSLVWDVTVVCPLADSYVASAAREAISSRVGGN